jgi:hypothetical protein
MTAEIVRNVCETVIVVASMLVIFGGFRSV